MKGVSSWKPMDIAPKDCEILGKYKKKKPIVIHYAEGGGEEQPYYKGWFCKQGDLYVYIEGQIEDWKWKEMIKRKET